MKRLASATAVFAIAASSFFSFSAAAGPPTVDRCAQAAEDGQKLRDESKLKGARDKFLECGSEACPAVVRRDCIRWKGELDNAIATVVVRAVDKRAQDVSGAKLLVDGVNVKDRLDGGAVPVDPGEHTLTVIASSGAKAEQRVVLSRTEHDRVVTLTFDRELNTDGAALGSGAGVIVPPTEPQKSYVLPIFLGGAAVLSLGVFAAFDATAWSKYKNLEDGCGMTAAGCSSSDTNTVRTQFRIAGVTLVAGLILGAVAGYFFAFPPEQKTPGVAFTGDGIRGVF